MSKNAHIVLSTPSNERQNVDIGYTAPVFFIFYCFMIYPMSSFAVKFINDTRKLMKTGA